MIFILILSEQQAITSMPVNAPPNERKHEHEYLMIRSISYHSKHDSIVFRDPMNDPMSQFL